MTEQQKQAIIESGKQYFRSIIIPNHLKNLNKLHLSSFDINPFLINYLAAFIKEDSQIIGLAKALVYPYIYDKVIDASSEQDVLSLVSLLQEVTGGASNFDGIDFEFVDAVDGRRKFCQFKAGVKTINKDDIASVLCYFKPLISQPSLDLQFEDLVVGVLYGEKDNLSDYYKTIATHYPCCVVLIFGSILREIRTFMLVCSRQWEKFLIWEILKGANSYKPQLRRLQKKLSRNVV